jgi:hypothetical protein
VGLQLSWHNSKAQKQTYAKNYHPTPHVSFSIPRRQKKKNRKKRPENFFRSNFGKIYTKKKLRKYFPNFSR